MHPRVSVIMPAYNAARYIREAILSIEQQTFSDWELLIIDDASTDETMQLARRFAAVDQRIKIFENIKNLGVAAARNQGISRAQGEYIAWQDSDDISLPYRLERQVAFLDSHPSVGLVGGFLEMFGQQQTPQLRTYAPDDVTLRQHIFRYQVVAQPAAMVRKICFEKVGMFNAELRTGEDLDMTFRIGTHFAFANLQEPVLRYRVNPGSLTYTTERTQELVTLNIRWRYRSHPAYQPRLFDYIYNVIQLFTLYLMPVHFRIWLFNRLRNVPAHKPIVFACHSWYQPDGTIIDSHWAFTFEFFNHYFGKSYEVLRHSLSRGGQTRIYTKGISGPYHVVPLVGQLPDLLRYGAEVVVSLVYLASRLFRGRYTYIAIDPLTAFPGVMLKVLRFPVRVIFITPDFARQRFVNSVLNWLYFMLDKFCTIHADYNYCCAQTVIDYKQQLYGDALKPAQLVHFPNVPGPWILERYKHVEKTPCRIVYSGNLAAQIDFYGLLDAFARIHKDYPQSLLVIIGQGQARQALEQYVQNRNMQAVTFAGQLSYSETLQAVAQAEVGIALYTGNFNYDEFRDSLKIREYQALGVIPLISKVARANAQEIERYHSGVIIEQFSDIESALRRIFSEPDYADQLRRAALHNYQIYQDKYEQWYKVLRSL